MISDNIPLLMAHRGGRFWEGNNFSYISGSIDEGADIIELDVSLKKGEYIVQHSPLEKAQGSLSDALKRIGDKGIYLDIKDESININELISFVRLSVSGSIIVGTYHERILKEIRDPNVERALHIFSFQNALKRAEAVQADWVTPLPYFITPQKAREIQDAGFKFVPSGNQIFKKREFLKNQVRFMHYGAYVISTFHIKEMKALLVAAK